MGCAGVSHGNSWINELLPCLHVVSQPDHEAGFK